MNDFAATHRRWGYKRAWARAKSEGIVVGRDTFRRLWRTEGLRVRPRKAPLHSWVWVEASRLPVVRSIWGW